MSISTRTRVRLGALAAMAVAVPAALVAAGSPAVAHGSVTDPPTRNYGCLERWGDDHLNPAMATLDPMCWAAFQADPTAMWNWNGLYRENVGGRHEEVIPDGQLCSGGLTEGGRYAAMDTPGAWTATEVDERFTLTLTDGAEHGADYLRIYVSKPSFDPLTERLGWDDLDLITETGSYPRQGTYVTDVDLTGYSGRAVLFTIWQASHLDQPYYLCSDIIIGGDGQTDPGPDPEPEPDPDPEPEPEPDPQGVCTAAVTVVNSWPGGYQADVRVTAGSAALSRWSVAVGGATITQAWNGNLSGATISSASWNGSISAGGTTTAGFLGSGSPTGLTATCSGA